MKEIDSGQNIVFYANSFWNLYNFRIDLIKAFLSEGRSVYCIANKDEYIVKLQDLEGVVVVGLESTSRSFSLIDFVTEIRTLRKLLKGMTSPVVLVWTFRSILVISFVNRLMGSFVILANISGLGSLYLSANPLIRLIYFAMYKLSLSRVRHIFFQNSSDMHLFNDKKMYSCSSEIIQGSGINLKENVPINVIPSKPYRVVFIGRLIRDKGILEFCDAVEKMKDDKDLSDLEFSIAGAYGSGVNAINRDFLDSKMKEVGIRYCGVFDNASEFYRRCDVVVLPSYREGMSKVLIEACAHGLPIITTNVPGCRETVLNNRNGFLVSPKSVEDLVGAFRKLTTLTPENLVEMGRVSRRIADEKFDVKNTINKYKIAIEEQI